VTSTNSTPPTASPGSSPSAPVSVSTTPRRPANLQANIIRKGNKRFVLGDAYHVVLLMKWRWFISIIFATQIFANLLFAIPYALEDGAIANSHGFVDAFFFSVQTWGTIGYGGMTPTTTLANTVVVLESTSSTVFMAVVTGLVFAKFSRPTARVLFAKKAVINTRDGKRYLMFRLANERGNSVIETSCRVALLRDEVSREGERMRRILDLTLVRNTQPVFLFSWTVMHEIDAKSPLFGLDNADLAKQDLRLTINVMGLDGTMSQTVHATYMYWPEDIEVDKRYIDVMSPLPDGRLQIDFEKFHDTEPIPLPREPADS
jgi:inward rectifier potassium channel